MTDQKNGSVSAGYGLAQRIGLAAGPVVFGVFMFTDLPASLSEPGWSTAGVGLLQAAAGLPVATPPNAIVYGSNRVSVAQMSRAGFVLNLVFIAIVTLVGYTLVPLVFDVEIGAIPDWAG